MKHLNITVYGIVQGVGFRSAAKQQARYLDIKGFIKNELDESVYIEAEGNHSALTEFVLWCKKGPAFARVEEVKVEEENLKYYASFDIRY